LNQHAVIISWSAEDEAYVADVPELPGCVAHGGTQEEALANAKEAAGLWMETARESGDSVPQPKGSRLIFA
jgi:predicted RNase H-like HicB family nuclease